MSLNNRVRYIPNRKQNNHIHFGLINNQLDMAIRYHQSGQLEAAEQIYKGILASYPEHSNAMHLLGVIAYQNGKSEQAVNLIIKAIQISPNTPSYYNNLGSVFQSQKNLQQAVACFEKAINLQPNFADAYYNLGVSYSAQNKIDSAVLCYQNALKFKSNDPKIYNNLGIAYKLQGKFDLSISCYQKAIQLKPDLSESYNNLGNVLKEVGRIAESADCYQSALKIKPNYAEVYNNLGNLHKEQGDYKGAFSFYQKAIEIKPDFAEAFNNIATIYDETGFLNEAITYYQKAIEIKPEYPEANNNIGKLLKDIGRLEDSNLFLQKAIQLKPDFAEAYVNLGITLQSQGKLNQAIIFYKKALQIKPDYAKACSQAVHLIQKTCDWNELEPLSIKLDDFTNKAFGNENFKIAEEPFMSLSRTSDPLRLFNIAKLWGNEINIKMSNFKLGFSFEDRKIKKSKITVGYLSNDFRNHAVSHLIVRLFGLHNRDFFNINCYSYGPDDGSYYREIIQKSCDNFIDLRSLNHVESAEKIYNDKVDILVDLTGYTTGNRLEICALRPAPIQIGYIGYTGTIGADFFDYIITDKIVTPESDAKYYSEKFIYMPNHYQITDNKQAISNNKWKKSDFDLPENSFLFCSFTQSYKIDPMMFNTWMNILNKVQESVIWLSPDNETAKINLKNEAKLRGVNPDRLIFAKQLPLKADHLSRIKLCDLALDTKTFNGHSTTIDALWSGVPVLTIKGNSFASRVSSSSLYAIGMPELITHTLEEYEEKAVYLAKNPNELNSIKQKLENNKTTEPLFNTENFVRNLEQAYQNIIS